MNDKETWINDWSDDYWEAWAPKCGYIDSNLVREEQYQPLPGTVFHIKTYNIFGDKPYEEVPEEDTSGYNYVWAISLDWSGGTAKKASDEYYMTEKDALEAAEKIIERLIVDSYRDTTYRFRTAD